MLRSAWYHDIIRTVFDTPLVNIAMFVSGGKPGSRKIQGIQNASIPKNLPTSLRSGAEAVRT
jgi:hypothetical protein